MFWNTFYKLCEENNTKPNAVAKTIGVSSATCTKWKNGTIPNGDTLLKLAEHLGCSVDYLLGRTDEPKPETSDPTTQILVERFNALSPEDKIAVLNMVLERSKK